MSLISKYNQSNCCTVRAKFPLSRYSYFIYYLFQSRDLESGQSNGSPGSPYSQRSRIQLIKRSVNAFLKTIFILSLAILFCGGIWYMMGLVFLIQLVLVAVVAYLVAGGGYRFPYIVYKTAWRDG